MITELQVSNYRSLGFDVKLCPSKMTIIVGPNGSGKSNVLDVLTFVRDAMLQGLPAAITHRGGIGAVRRRSQGAPYNVRISLQIALDAGAASFGFELAGDRVEDYRVKSEWASAPFEGDVVWYKRERDQWQGPQGLSPRIDNESLALNALGGDERFKSLVDFLSSLTVYSVFPDTLRAPQKFDPVRPMRGHGENWVSILRELITHEGAKEDLIRGLRKLSGDIEDVRVTSAAGYLIAEFSQETAKRSNKRKKWFEAGLQSDGTLRVAGLLTALLQEPCLPMCGIEEPELTVHPGVLPMLYDYLHQTSERSQVIVTTHSPIILDCVDLDACKLFVVDRASGVTSAMPVPPKRLEPVRQRLLSLGDLYVSGDLQVGLPFPEASQ